MKKIVSIMSIFLVLFALLYTTEVYAAPLDSVNITTDKQTVHPGQTVKVNVAFGKDLGSYTVDVAYDRNLLEFVSAEGGTENDNGTRIRVYFFDNTGGSNPRNNMSVTFKAKTGIITSNPTNLSITAEGLASPDASVRYDDITTPVVKNLVVEPEYVPYNIALNYSGDVIKNEPKDMKIVISSSMGKNYEHTRIMAEATTPTNETVKLLGTDAQNLEHDIIQNGWGDAAGDPIGGKDVSKELNVKGLFSGAGTYGITLKLVDRDNSDAVIASKNFQIEVKEKTTVTPPTETPEETPDNDKNVPSTKPENSTKPNDLPKTGNTVYLSIAAIVVVLVIGYVYLKKD